MSSIKLRYKKDRKVFVPDTDIDLPDNFEIEIEKPLEGTKMTDDEVEVYVQKLREKFVREFKKDFGIDISNDHFVKLIGSEAKYLINTTYEGDKKRIMDAVAEKYNRGYND